MSLYEIVQEFENHKNLHRNEGRQGVENLCRLVNAMGYQDSMHFGQFAHNGAIGDLVEFLEDNPGCIEAIKSWICKQNIQEWHDNLESECPARKVADEYDGICPDCQEDIPDDAVEGDECADCGHVFVFAREDD
jgi:hypothetical protein